MRSALPASDRGCLQTGAAMTSIRISNHEDGASFIEPVRLPYRLMTRPIDPSIFVRQSRGEDIGRPRLTASAGLRACHEPQARDAGWAPCEHRVLGMMVSGELRISTADGTESRLLAGDVFLLEDRFGVGHQSRFSDNCRWLELFVPEAWLMREPSPQRLVAGAAPADAMPTLPSHEAARVWRDVRPGGPALERMYTATDGRSYFHPFRELFAQPGASAARTVRGFHCVSFPDGYFIDWHPEGCNNLVFISGGALDLQVGGDGSRRLFAAGDVCLAQDRVGEGHIDRALGLTDMVLIEFEDAHLWPFDDPGPNPAAAAR